MNYIERGLEPASPLARAPEFAELVAHVMDYMAKANNVPFAPGRTRIPLSVPTYASPEVAEVLDSLVNTQVTMGRKVRRFEEMFAEYIGQKHAIMVNSGSSANLLALSCLGLKPGDEIITPALTWATTVFPIAQLGYTPVLADVELETYNIDPDAVERAIGARTRAILPVHLLGNPCRMAELQRIADHHGLLIIEDACEAHGAEYYGRKAGSFGCLSTFSFFFSHHISTIEGGMVLTSDDGLADLCRSLRSHGWTRESSRKAELAAANPGIDPRFLFVNRGYNLRPTELQGAFGMHQLPRLEEFIWIRQRNAAYWNEHLAQYGDYLYLPHTGTNTRHSWFSYPVTVNATAPFTKSELQDFLESKGLETRPIEAGNMASQPVMRAVPHRVAGPLNNARYIHENGFFWGNHHGIGTEERAAIVGYFDDFFKGLKL